MMDFLLGKCIILKNLPETASEEDVRKCLELNNLSDAFHDIERYAVNDTDIRWIILFNTAEDAMMCLHTKAWVYPNGDDRALITPEICVENLIPDRWLEQMQVSIISETANKESEYVPMQSFGLSVLMTSDLDEDFEIDIGESGSESVISTKVTITGFQVVTANEEMKTFFESKSRSGGGDIVAFELNQYRNVVTVEFKNHNDATEVLKKANKEGGILYNGMMLKVSPFIEPLIDTSKVFVSGMSDKTSDELAALFMEAKWHIVPKKLVRGILPGTALVEFNSHPDITKLKSICEKNACAEAFWNVSLVEVPSKVLVTGCSSTTTIEVLDLYFENKKRSGGGDVLYVEPHHDFSNEFVISFNNVSDAERVCKGERTHILDNYSLTVSLYYPCLDRAFVPPVSMAGSPQAPSAFPMSMQPYFPGYRGFHPGNPRLCMPYPPFPQEVRGQLTFPRPVAGPELYSTNTDSNNSQHQNVERPPICEHTNVTTSPELPSNQTKRTREEGAHVYVEPRDAERDIRLQQDCPDGYTGFYMPYPFPNWPRNVPPGQIPFPGPVSRPEFYNLNTDSMNSQYQTSEGSTHVKTPMNDRTNISLCPELPPAQNKSTAEVYLEPYEERNIKLKEDDPDEHIYDSVDSMTMLDSETNKPNVPQRETQLRIFVDDENVEAVSCPKVTVTGFQPDMVNEEMELFFESKSKSGGGDIVAFELSKNKKAVTIEYKTCSDAEDVLKKANKEGGIQYKGTWLKVTKYIEPKIDPVRVFVSGMSEKTTDEIASLFMEAKWRFVTKKIVRGEMPGTAIIEFNKQPDISYLKTICERHACAEAFWTVSPVELSSKVLVRECNPKTTAESLELYFENTNRSGGGDVLYVEPHHDISKAFIVSFKHVSDAERVVKEDRTHVLDSCNLTVSLYYPCLDRDPEEEIAIPEPALIDDLDQYRTKFLFESDQQKAKIEASLKDVFGRPVWIIEKNNSKLLQIECTVDPKDSLSRPFINNWEERCRERISWIFEELTVDETNVVASELFEQLKIKLQSVKVRRPEALAIVLDRKSSGIVIVGESKEVDELSKDIAKLIRELENGLAKNNETATKILKFKNYEFILLQACNISSRVQTEFVQITMDGETKQITLSGWFQDVANAVSIVQDTLTNFVRTEVTGYTQLSVDLMFKNQTRHIIKKALFKKKLIGVWDFEKRTTLYMYSSNENDLQKCLQVLRETVSEWHRKLSEDDQAVLCSSQGTDFLHQLETKHEGLIKFALKGKELRIASVAEVTESIQKELESFITANSEACEIIEIEAGKFQFIFTNKKDELIRIEEQHQRQKVICTTIDETTKKGFMFQGPQSAVKATITKVQTLIDNIVLKDIVITTPGFGEFIERKSGKRALKEIQDKRQCILRYGLLKANSEKPELCDDTTIGDNYAIGSCKLTLVVQDITLMRSDASPAIVNPCSTDLSNSLGLGDMLIKKGGRRIQQELDAQKDNVMIGNVYVTTAGNLPYKAVLHVVVPTWSDKSVQENRLLSSAIFNVIEHADKMGFKKVVTPPIGTGIPGFPPELVAETMIDTFTKYFHSGKKCVIENIVICDIKPESIDTFSRTLDSGDEARLRERRQEAQPRSSSLDSKVSVVIGTLANTKADVLVNSTNQDLDLRVGTISKQLVAAAGEELIEECHKRYPNGLLFGKIAVTSAGRMKTSQRIFHGLLPMWDFGKGQSETMLFEFVIKCLQKAAGNKFRSIAFPALGTGALGYPSDKVADIMFEAVERFFKDTPNNSVESIYFVIWAGDDVAISAFQEVEKDKKTNIERRRTKPSQYIPNVGEEYAVAEERGDFTTTIGNVSLKIVQEDLVKQTTGGIVNSTLDELDLSKGLVSKAILQAAGQAIQLECWSDANKQRIQTEGIVVTGPGKLMCQKIFHLKARSSASGWSESLSKCLQEVEKFGLNSVALPALGTGGKGLSPDTMAKTMYQAVKQYVENNKGAGSLTSVRIVLFNSDLVDQFTSTIRNLAGPTQSRKSFFSWPRKQLKTPTVTIYIYAKSAHYAQQAASDIQEVYDTRKIGIPKTFMKSHLDSLKQRADVLDVNLVVGTDSIVIQGLKSKLDDMKEAVDICMANIDRNVKTLAATKSIPLPQSWNMRFGDGPQVVMLKPFEQEYTTLAQRFCSETLVRMQTIVSIERIQNPTLYVQYYGKKKEMETANKGSQHPIERRLWHGLQSADAAKNINQKGFNRNVFSVNARSSLRYCQPDATGSRRMYCADVLTGDFCPGIGNITKSPSRNDPSNPTRCFDSTTDNLAAPDLFGIFHHAQAYPSFLITFG